MHILSHSTEKNCHTRENFGLVQFTGKKIYCLEGEMVWQTPPNLCINYMDVIVATAGAPDGKIGPSLETTVIAIKVFVTPGGCEMQKAGNEIFMKTKVCEI